MDVQGLQTQAFVYSEDDRFVDWTGGYYSATASIIEAEGLLGLWSAMSLGASNSLQGRVACYDAGARSL